MAKRAPGNSTKAETTGHEWDGVTELNKDDSAAAKKDDEKKA